MEPEAKKARKSFSMVDGFHIYSSEMTEYSSLIWHGDKESFVFSPLLSQINLIMLYMGAKDRTASQIAEVIGNNDEEEILAEIQPIIESVNHERNTLKIGSRIFIKNTFELDPKFKRTLKRNCRMVGIESLDVNDVYACVASINSWAAQTTGNKIQNFAAINVEPALKMQLVGVTYVSAEWVKEFKPRLTVLRPFWINTTRSVDVAMMKKCGYEKFATIPELDAKVLDLDFKNTEIKMMFILPNNRENGIGKLKMKLSDVRLREIVDRLEQHWTCAQIPKMNIENEFDEAEVLDAMGIDTAFNGMNADFTGISGERDETLWITGIMQKTVVKVAEEGLNYDPYFPDNKLYDACNGCGDYAEEIFVVDHPFAFIVHLDAIPLLQGFVVNDQALVRNLVQPDHNQNPELN